MIPRRMHQVWFGGPVPDQFAEWRERWIDMHPDWDHYLWTDDGMPALFNSALFDAADAIAGRYAGQFRSDIARYEILKSHGGVYVDMDCEPRKPLDPLLDPTVRCFLGWEVPGKWLNNAVMGAEQGSPFLCALIRALPANVEANRGARPNVMTGPQFVTPIALRSRGVVAYPKHYFYPYLHNELGRAGESFPDSYCVHHWNNARRRLTRR